MKPVGWNAGKPAGTGGMLAESPAGIIASTGAYRRRGKAAVLSKPLTRP